SVGAQVEHARAAGPAGHHHVSRRGSRGVNAVGRHVDAHAGEARGDSAGAGGAIGQAGEVTVVELELANQVDRAGERVFFVIDGAVEVKEDGVEVGEGGRHGEE